MNSPGEAADNPLLAAALWYAELGLQVVPLHEPVFRPDGTVGCTCPKPDCGSQGKHPRLNAWEEHATTDPGVIRGWWAAWPGANVGVRLGSASGVVAADVDPPHGEAVLAEISGGDLPPTWEMTTGKGRRPLYAVPDTVDVEPRTRVVRGPDKKEAVRLQGGTGGHQCVVPPSLHPNGRRYEWAAGRSPADLPAAPMPAWLIGRMCERPDPVWSDQAARDAFAEGSDFNRQADWLRDVLGPAGFKPAGSRGDVLDFTRPGKNGGVSATVGHYRCRDGTPALYVFSGSIPELDAGHCYDKFGAYARLFCGGDFTRAADQLAAKGYAKPRPAAKAAGAGHRPPAGEPAKPAAWPPLIPLDQAGRPAPFPADVLPGALQEYVENVAHAVGTPVDYPGVFMVGVAAGLIGATLELRIDDGWSERPVLYACVVAPKSSGKTPCFQAITKPVRAEQAERSHKEDAKTSRPVYADDATTESLAPVLKRNPRGLLIAKDELSGWVASFNQYRSGGKGADRQFWLQNWAGASLNVLRRNPDSPHIFVPIACVSVVGGIQPAVADDLRGGRDDGFSERILFSYPDPLPARRYEFRGHPGADAWRTTARLLLGREMVGGDYGDRPFYVGLSAEARAVFGDWTGELAAANNDPDRDQSLDGVRSKLRGTAGRLALVVHALRAVTHGEQVGDELPGADMARGVALARYFLDHAGRVLGSGAGDPRVEAARRIVAHLRRKRLASFSRSDLWCSLRRSFARPEDLAEPLRLLAQLNHLQYADQPAPKVGRKPTPRYEVNPELFGSAGPNNCQTTPAESNQLAAG